MKQLLPLTIAILCLAVQSCTDPKEELLHQHQQLYTSYIADLTSLLVDEVITEESQKLLQAVQDLDEERVSTTAKRYGLDHLLPAYYHALGGEAADAETFLLFLASQPDHSLSLQGIRRVIPDQTEVAPKPFVAVYKETSAGKRLEWCKYDKVGQAYRLDLLFNAKHLDKKLRKEVKEAKADYAELDVEGYLKNRFDKTNKASLTTAIKEQRKTILNELIKEGE